MPHRFFPVCALVAVLIAMNPPLRAVPIGAAITAPIDPARPNAVCLYVPPVAPSNSTSSTTWQFEPSMPTSRHSFGFAWLPATYNVYAIGGMLGWQDAVTATLNVPSESVLNIVTIDDGAGTILRRAAGGRRVLLPLIRQ